jgi:NADPH:quinone reductase-like Zn-dependent oxidoreductase
MKAAQIHDYGGPEVLRIEDVPEPSARANEVLVRVRACSLNHLDVWVRKAMPKAPSLPWVLGSDASGEVVTAGELCTRIRPGERVLLSPGLSCRQCVRCLEGRDNECRGYGLLGGRYPGVNRELINIPEYAVIPIPDDLSFEDAAATPLVFLTAWHMLIGRAALQPGEDVLVLGASSGVGHAAVQIAKLFQCRVIATAGNEAKLGRARELGADHVIDHYQQDISAEVKRVTGKRGVDVVFEHPGAATWDHSVASLAASGRLVTCGATTGSETRFDLRNLYLKQQSFLGSFMGRLAELHHVLRFIFRKQLKPVVDRVYPLAEIAEAHRRLEAREQFGKIVLTV